MQHVVEKSVSFLRLAVSSLLLVPPPAFGDKVVVEFYGEGL